MIEYLSFKRIGKISIVVEEAHNGNNSKAEEDERCNNLSNTLQTRIPCIVSPTYGLEH